MDDSGDFERYGDYDSCPDVAFREQWSLSSASNRAGLL
jgi:hypothetical protein